MTGQVCMDTLCAVVKAGRKPIIGILGGVCSGKSTAAAEFAKLGCAVIDADQIAHQLLDDEQVRAKIVWLFGEVVLDDGGGISRAKLAEEVFSDGEKLKNLTDILHPLVLARTEELIAEYQGRGEVKAIVLDMPLLVEVGWDKQCDSVIFIDCNEKKRLERAPKGGIFDSEQLKVRENLQISLDIKRRIADTITDNNSDLSGLSKQIANILSDIVDNG